jgi:hypothetical protein
MKIGEYILSRRISAPGPQPQAGTVLELRKATSDTGPVSGAMVYFTDQPRPATRTDDWLYVLLPSAEFDLWYRVASCGPRTPSTWGGTRRTTRW